MLMQKHSPTNNNNNTDDINSNSIDSTHSNVNFYSGRNNSIAGSECNDDKSNDVCSSDDESHEHDNTEQENQSYLDNPDQYKSSIKKKKKKAVKVKFSGSHEDKAGIKLKIRRTNNFNQDENHIIVDPAEHMRKRHLKTKRNKTFSQEQDGFKSKSKLDEVSNTVNGDDNFSQKRMRQDSDEEISRVSIGVNTCTKGTEVDENFLGPCQAGTKITLNGVVYMETSSGILIVSVQWRGKTLTGALMESERYQIGSLEKDSIYRREKLMGLNRRNTRRKSKNLFGKKKRKTTPPDSSEVGGTENEAGNSDIDNPYICDKENCQMKFGDFQTLRVHIYQNHRIKEEPSTNELDSQVVIKPEPIDGGNIYGNMDGMYSGLKSSPFPKHLTTSSNNNNNPDSKPPHIPELVRSDQSLIQTNHLPLTPRNKQSPLPPDSSHNHQPPEERNSFSPAYSDISDANEAPVLENETEIKLSSASVSQPPINLSLGASQHILSSRIFSPGAPQLQPEVNLCSASSFSTLRFPTTNDSKLPKLSNYYPKFDQDQTINGFLHAFPNQTKTPQSSGVLPLSNGGGNLSSSTTTVVSQTQHDIIINSQNSVNSIQDLSLNAPLNLYSFPTAQLNHTNSGSSSTNKLTTHNHKTTTNVSCHSSGSNNGKSSSVSRQSQSHNNNAHIHSISNGLSSTSQNSQQNSKHSNSLSLHQSEHISSNPSSGLNGVPMSHTMPYMSFGQQISNQSNSKFNHPVNHVYKY